MRPSAVPAIVASLSLLLAVLATPAEAQTCVQCHEEVTPGIVADWVVSRHKAVGVGCGVCHGADHQSADDVAKVKLPLPETCAQCHPKRTEEFKRGKHAFAWAALNAMPTTHALPMALTEGFKGCGGCHKLGTKSAAEVERLKARGGGFGLASCDACHTRHTFSSEEARQPQACQTCHMGFDHPQWEMYSSSKHGVRNTLKQLGKLPESAAAPTCQTCHMQDGNHEVRTPWGFLAVRLPLPDDPQWKADQVTILQALGVLDPEGNPTPRLEVVKAAQVARLTQEDFDRERAKLMKACSQCHSESFAREEMAKGDAMIKAVDHLLAQAIREVAALYEEGVLEQPEGYAHAFPDLLTFHDAPRPIEQTLFVMHLKHRMRAFQGTFHANPDYALWYGWSEMVRDLAEIREMARELRERHARGG
jgi:hydroxylamine dehydrogenase